MKIEHNYSLENVSVSAYYSTYCKSMEVSITERNGEATNIVKFSLNQEKAKSFLKEMAKINEEIESDVDSE